MKNHSIRLLLLGIPLFIMTGCIRSGFEGFETSEKGVLYKVHYLSGDTAKPGKEDWVTVRMDYRLEDTMLFTYQNLDKPLRFAMIEPEFEGDIYNALRMMSTGDSMTFAIVADSFFLKTARLDELPAYVEPGDPMYYDVKVTEILSDEEFKAEIEAQKVLLLEKEMQTLQAYIDSAGIGRKPESSGLYFIPLVKGKGKRPDTGDMCRIHLKVQQMNSHLLFDNFGDEPIEVEYGKGFDTEGFREGLGMLQVGGRAQLLVPSPIGVGDQGREVVPPFTTLIYEVELVDVVPLEEVKAERERRKQARAEENERLKEAEPKLIKAYLVNNDLNLKPLPSGLYFVELEKGTGEMPESGEKVKVHYILSRLDGRELQNSYNSETPYEFILGQGRVIRAWDEAVAMMSKGSKAMIIAPSNLAYGSRGRGRDIGPYTTLVFELELLED
jgi:peptidylprolyl isomerase